MKGTAQMGSAECKWKVPQAAAKRSCMIPQHSTQGRCFLLGVNFGDGCPSGYQPCPTGLKFGDQMGTSVFPWTSRITPYSVKTKGFFGFLSCYKMSFFMYLPKIISWLHLLLFTFIYSTQDLALWIILIPYQSRLRMHSLDLIPEQDSERIEFQHHFQSKFCRYIFLTLRPNKNMEVILFILIPNGINRTHP